MTWVFPAYGYDFGGSKQSTVLPRDLPSYSRHAFTTHRDYVLLSTPYHESLWAQAVATAVTKSAAWGWEASGEVALRRKRGRGVVSCSTNTFEWCGDFVLYWTG
jgi:hypothetical protein